MRKLIFIPLVVCFWLAFDDSRALALELSHGVMQRVVYKTYTNARYDYSISYPSNLLNPRGEADNGDGQIFSAPDGLTEMRVYGSQDLGGGLAAAFRAAQDGKAVSYKTIRRDWFIVSGRSGGKIFYQKTLFKNGVLKTFTIEYDESRKAVYDPLTARIARSFVG